MARGEGIGMDIEFGTFLFIVFILLGSITFGSYRLGRHLERRDLTQALKNQIVSIYNEGKEDGYKELCR